MTYAAAFDTHHQLNGVVSYEESKAYSMNMILKPVFQHFHNNFFPPKHYIVYNDQKLHMPCKFELNLGLKISIPKDLIILKNEH